MIKSFSQYRIEESLEFNSVVSFLELETLLDESQTLEEAWSQSGILVEESNSRIGKFLSSMGIHAHKTGPGLIGDLRSAGKGFFKFFVAVLRGDWETVKSMANKEIKKEDVLDFILRLDQATLHILTGPIHSLEALTGWHIWANIKKASEKTKEVTSKVVSRVKDALEFIKSKVSSHPDPKAKTVFKAISKIEKRAPKSVLEA